MVYLTLYWPKQHPRQALAENSSTVFDVLQGQLLPHADSAFSEGVVFHYTGEVLRLENRQQHYPCYVDGHLLAYGESRALLIQSTVQLGRFSLVVENEESENSLLQVLGYADGCGNDAQLPELVDILNNSLQHVTEEPDNEKKDVLKALEKEFRQALIWGIQTPHARHSGAPRESRFNENIFNFDVLQAQVKSATVTHCIFETPALIHKVFSELKLEESDSIRGEEDEKKDVLRLLAPEEVRYDSKKRIPALLVQEIYRADLDTLL